MATAGETVRVVGDSLYPVPSKVVDDLQRECTVLPCDGAEQKSGVGLFGYLFSWLRSSEDEEERIGLRSKVKGLSDQVELLRRTTEKDKAEKEELKKLVQESKRQADQDHAAYEEVVRARDPESQWDRVKKEIDDGTMQARLKTVDRQQRSVLEKTRVISRRNLDLALHNQELGVQVSGLTDEARQMADLLKSSQDRVLDLTKRLSEDALIHEKLVGHIAELLDRNKELARTIESLTKENEKLTKSLHAHLELGEGSQGGSVTVEHQKNRT